MEFGHLSIKELDSIQFSLPEDSAFTKEIQLSFLNHSTPQIYVGCAKWGRKEWVGKIYPEGTKEAKFLDYYVRHFNSIELNATHYRIYGPSTISNWAAKASNKDFKFCPKTPQAISHYSDLISPRAKQLTDEFLKGIIAFKEHLGPIFLQVSEKFSPSKKDNLIAYLKDLPEDLQFFVELRHPGWFSDKKVSENLFQSLRELKVGAVITDTAGRRDCLHMELTLPKAFIRFVGNNLHPTDYSRIDLWVSRLKDWLNKGLQELYFFMHQPDEQFSPELCNYVVEQMNKHCNSQLIKPQFIGE